MKSKSIIENDAHLYYSENTMDKQGYIYHHENFSNKFHNLKLLTFVDERIIYWKYKTEYQGSMMPTHGQYYLRPGDMLMAKLTYEAPTSS